MTGLAATTAAILAGGLGTRLRAAVADRPKVLAEVNGRSFLTYLLEQLADGGVRRVVLCTGYMADAVRETIGGRFREMTIEYAEESAPLGTGGALRLALPLLGSDPILVMNGDSFFDADLASFAARHRASGGSASILLAETADVGRFGAVAIARDNTVVRFEEKGGRGPGLINAGIYLFNRTVIAAIPPGEETSLEREVFPRLVGRGLHGFPQHGRFIDIGVPSDYEGAAAFFAGGGDPAPSREKR